MSYRLFRATFTQDGETKASKKWYVEFRDHLRTVRRLAGYTSKSATDELGRNLVRLVEYHSATGGQVDPALSSWLSGLPMQMRQKLVSIGLLSGERFAASKPLGEHVADWAAALGAKSTTAKQVALLTSRVSKVFDGCGFKFYSDIAATKVQAFLNDLRADADEKRGISAQTSNFYLTATKQFCRWMVKHGRATGNPVDHLEPLNVRLDRRHDRRALSVSEVKKLLTATAARESRGGMTGPERRLLYLLALETGLRANELRSLTRSSFHLDPDSPTVTVAAGYSKRRRQDTLPLRKALTAELRAHLTSKLPAAPAFNVPCKETLSNVYKSDIRAAGIAYRDEEGRVADFHSLRHTFITNLARSGVHPKAAQALARHSTITLTMDRYSHTLIGEQADALKGLPDLTGAVAGEVRKTGTHDSPSANHLASCLAFSERKQYAKVDSDGLSVSDASEGGGGGETPENSANSNKSKRKGRDSNPRTPCGVAGFQDRCIQPLCHPSGIALVAALAS
jgi:integrase